MTPRDLAEVFELDLKEPSSWSRQQFEEELSNFHGLQFVARDSNEKLVAFVCSRVVGEEAELFKLTVSGARRRQGIGYALLGFVLDQFKIMGVSSCYLELRAQNTAARKLYEKSGFVQGGARKNYYDSPREDALLMKMEM